MQPYYTLIFTTYTDNGDSYLTETVRFDDKYRAIEMARNVIEIERWVSVRVMEHGRYEHPSIEFDWKFYNQPAWAKHILGMEQDDEEEE